jgi:hypothetical protein
MTFQTNTITLTGILCCLFWCAIYGLALLVLSVSRMWLILTSSKSASVESQSNFIPTNNPLNHKTT